MAVCCWCGAGLAKVKGVVAWVCPTPTCQTRQMASAVSATVGKGKTTETRWVYVPTPRQAEFDQCRAKYVLFGGAAGPGKSHAARWALYRRCLLIPGFEALLLRRTFPELEQTHLRRMEAEAGLIGATFAKTDKL